MPSEPSHLRWHNGRAETARWRRGDPGTAGELWVMVGTMPHPDPRWWAERSCDYGFGQVCDTEGEALAVAARWRRHGDWTPMPPRVTPRR